MFLRFDNFLCTKSEDILHKIQKAVGIDCIQFAWTMFTLAILAELWNGINAVYQAINPEPTRSLSTVLLGEALMLGIIAFFGYIYKKHAGDKLYDLVSKGLKNPLRQEDFFSFQRLLTVWIFILEASLSFYLEINPLVTGTRALFLVIGSCTPLPPSESKLKQKIKELKASLAPAQPATNTAFHSLE